jgi:hypothetical protein
MYFCLPAYATRLIEQGSDPLMQDAFAVHAPRLDCFKAR